MIPIIVIMLRLLACCPSRALSIDCMKVSAQTSANIIANTRTLVSKLTSTSRDADIFC